MTDAAAKAEAAKAAGNAAFKAQDYDAAVKAFTEAIEADPTNHVLFSNRSGAHAAKAQFKEALLDANECIKLKGDWAKGHSRRGAAYFGLKNLPSAQASYEKGLELDPSSALIKTELEKIKQKRNPEMREASGSGSSGTQAYSRFPGDTGGFPGSGSCGPPTNPKALQAANALSAGALVSGFLYMLPLIPRYAPLMYKMSIVCVLLLFLLNLVCAFELKLSTLTDARFKAAQESQAFMLLIFLLASPPTPFALMPFLAGALLNACIAFKGAASSLPGPLKSLIGDRVTFLTTQEGTFQVHSFGAVSEAIVATMTPLLCIVQGMRAALLGFFFFQYVVRRYRTNELTVKAVDLLVERINDIFAHKYMPAPLQTVYSKAKSLIGMAAQKLVS
eukprot:CAMPEP_0115859474 /NCGR_PEP_ID=MMETSP0287-20121206/16633_1 /TAXON_ID=412157 /ORGANISM="Chrysochromulina rotalis, Strain UIO044" /LENGTH=389 /DNA_ID=CAMNT_0003313773 /DNA_START=12 /DNA_END=1181 /DNA_ORIENTATION=+